jgi:hypothetical protein
LEHTNPPALSNEETALDASSRPSLQLDPATWALAGALGSWVGKQIAGGIVSAAAGKAFNEVIKLIGLGDPDIAGRLDDISKQLSQVQESLNRLTEMTAEILKQLAELKQFMEKSLEITTLRAAVRRIAVAYDGDSASAEALLNEQSAPLAISLNDLLEKLPRYERDPQKRIAAAKDFATYVQDMPDQINTIYDTLAVAAFGQDSLLTHWVNELAQQINAKKITRENAYLVLEGYFLQAVAVQLKGVSVHCVALATHPQGQPLVPEYLGDTYAKKMSKQTAAFVGEVERMLFLTLAPTMAIGSKDGLGVREFPKEVDEILLRADLLCAALNLVGHKGDSTGKPSPSIQAAIQGIYGRALLRPSDLNYGNPPNIAPAGYTPVAGTAVRKLAFPCLDLNESDGRGILSDATSSAVTMAHYFWKFPSPEPAMGQPIDPSQRGGVTPKLYPVFGLDKDKQVLAASVFDVSRLYRGLATGAQKKFDFRKFPGGNPDLGYYDERCTPYHHALTNEKGDSFETFFTVVQIWRLDTRQHSYVVHPLFKYSGGPAKVRLSAHVASIIHRDPRRDGQGGTAFGQWWDVYSHLKLRRVNGWEKEFFNSVESYGLDRPISVNGGDAYSQWGENYDKRRDGSFSLDFDLEPGDYELVLDSEVAFQRAPKESQGWKSTSLSFFLHCLSLERV